MVPSVATEKSPSDTTGNRSRDRPTSSVVHSGRIKAIIPLEYNVVSTGSNIYLNILLLTNISGTWQGNI